MNVRILNNYILAKRINVKRQFDNWGSIFEFYIITPIKLVHETIMIYFNYYCKSKKPYF